MTARRLTGRRDRSENGRFMRIVLVNHYAGSPRHGMEFRPYFLARAWVAAGHEAIVVAASQSHLRNENPEVRGSRFVDSLDGIQYRWLRTPRYRGNGFGRIANMLSFLFRLRRELRILAAEGPIDAIIASSTYPLDYGACERWAWRTGAALLFEVHDLWPLSPMELGGYSARHPYIRLLQRAEDRFCRTADRVVSILPKTLDHLATRGLDPRRFCHLPNGVDASASLDRVALPAEIEEWMSRMRAEGRTLIGYAGGMVAQNSVETLLGAAERLRAEPFAFLLLGDGHQAEALRAAGSKLPHVRFFGRVPRAVAVASLVRCDGVWIGMAAKSLYRFGIGMNKIFDAMLTGRPVIASYTAGNDPIGEARCGFTVPAEDVEALVEALRRLGQMASSDRDALGRRGSEFVRREHDYGRIAERFVQVIREAKADPNPHRPAGEALRRNR
jgi:glycosyltransferase involved in cell wall biosynthesis